MTSDSFAASFNATAKVSAKISLPIGESPLTPAWVLRGPIQLCGFPEGALVVVTVATYLTGPPLKVTLQVIIAVPTSVKSRTGWPPCPIRQVDR